MSECIFCRIARGEVPVTLLHEDDVTVAFRDANPQAPFHALVVPRRHLASLLEVVPDERDLAGRLLETAARVARDAKLDGPDRGFRVVVNVGPESGQSVFHLHVHVLGGRPLAWPPG